MVSGVGGGGGGSGGGGGGGGGGGRDVVKMRESVVIRSWLSAATVGRARRGTASRAEWAPETEFELRV